MHHSSKNLIFHIANEVCKQSPDTPKQAETNRTNRADPQMLVPFKTPKKLGLNIAVYHIKCKKDTVLQHLYPSSAFLGWGMTFLLIFLRNICLRSRLLENNNNNGGYVLS